MRQHLWNATGASIPVHGHGISLLCTASYQHLGGIITATGSMAPEISQRSIKAGIPLLELSNTVFKSPQLQLCYKVSLAQSLATTMLLYNAGTWPALPDKLLAKLAGAYMRPFRRLSQLYSDAEGNTVPSHVVAQAVNILSLDCMLIASRLRFLRRVLLHAPPFVRRVLDPDSAWQQRALQDAACFYDQCSILWGYCGCCCPASYRGSEPSWTSWQGSYSPRNG